MSHEVETMAYVGAVPWHGLGVPITNPADAVSPERFLTVAGLDWEVVKVPVFAQVSAEVIPGIEVDALETAHGAIIRKSDAKVLGVVGPGYTPLQNKAAINWFAPFLESGKAQFESGGSLREGAIIWGLAKCIGLEALVRPGDSVENYILLTHGHDGMHAVRAGFTPIRVVCRNTLRAAEFSADSKLIRLKHTRNLKTALDMVQKIMDAATAEFAATIDQYRLLAKATGVNRADVRKYVKVVLEIEKVEDEDLSSVTEQKVERMTELAFTGRGNNGESYWDAYNGVTEYLSYEAGRTQDSRLRSLWLGDSATLSKRALDVAVEMATA